MAISVFLFLFYFVLFYEAMFVASAEFQRLVPLSVIAMGILVSVEWAYPGIVVDALVFFFCISR